MAYLFDMRYPQFLMVSLCIGALSQALAGDQPTPASAPTSTSAAPQSPAAAPESPESAAATQANADAQAKADADAKAKAVDKRLRALGYKPVNHNGTVRYCRNEQAIGSRFETQVCGTPEELDFAALNGKETAQKIQQMNGSQYGPYSKVEAK
jgi:hypothetical protein